MLCFAQSDESNAHGEEFGDRDVHLVYRPSLTSRSLAKKAVLKKNRSQCGQRFHCQPAYSAFQGRALKNIFYSNSVSRIDIFARVMYPLVFSVFNLVYWVYYLNASKRQSVGEAR